MLFIVDFDIAEQLSAISEFASLGPLFKSSQPIALTDEVTEYSVLCIKHIFPQHIVLQVKLITICFTYEILFKKYLFFIDEVCIVIHG